MQRVIHLQGANNFRDMGGYATQSGKHVCWGKLYRSDHLASLTDADLEILNKLGINTIFDFRSAGERQRYPGRLEVRQVMLLNPHSETAEQSAQISGNESLEDENKRLVKMAGGFSPDMFLPENNPIYQMYQSIVTDSASIAVYAKMLELFAKQDTAPVVMHCRGGKDRTGYAAAIILYLLGVSKKDIVEDYLLTGVLREERNALKMRQYRQLTDDEQILGFLYSLIDTKPEYIEASFTQMEQHSGSVEAYLENVLGVTPSLKEHLQSMYLE